MFRWPLRGCVKQGSCHRMGADDGAEIDDVPALCTEALDRLLHHENRPEHIDVVVNVKALLGDLRESAKAEEPGVVNQNVEPSEAQYPDRPARFEQEAEVLASLNHPNNAVIYGVEEPALAMQLV